MKTYKIVLIGWCLAVGSSLCAQDLTGVKIHINPGHGGFDSDDRGISTPLISADKEKGTGFWESQSNLDKGLQLRDMLEALNCTVQMSRTTNKHTVYEKDENGKDILDKIISTDDTPLSQIVRMANEFGADFMLSIHSNAGAGTANYVLQLYAGKDIDDTYDYGPTPCSDESRAISTLIGENQLKNQLTHWTSQRANISGDKTYARLYMGWYNGYGVLRNLKVPGVISEGSMHDYTPETYRLLNMDYKWLEAWNFKKAFCTYFKNAEIPTGNIAGWVKDSRNKLLDGIYMKYEKDRLLPLDGAKVTVIETGAVYTVDHMRNGVYVFKDMQPGNYTLKAEAEGYYSQTQQVTVVKNEICYFNFELNKVRNTPPEVVSHTPEADAVEVNCSANIVLNFNWDMDEEPTRAAFSIDPPVEGTVTFEDSQYRLRFKPTVPLEPSTTYTVRLDKSAKHPDNLSMETDFSFSFTTNSRNRIEMLESFPAVGATDVSEQPMFWFIFDKRIKSANAISVFAVRDKEGNDLPIEKFSRKTNGVPEPYGSYLFALSEPLMVGEEYTVVIDGALTDIIDITLGEPLEIPFTVSGIQTPQSDVLEDFEYFGSAATKDKYIPDGETSLNVSTHTATKAAKQLFGNSAAAFRVRFEEPEGHGVFRLADMEQGPLVPDRKVFGLYVYGDMSGNVLELEFSAGADARHMKLCDLDFGGWKFVEMEYVNPNPDGTQYKLTGFRIVRNAEKIMSGVTEIYLDNLLAYDELVNSLGETPHADMVVYPNPAKDRILVNVPSDGQTVSLQLYSLAGQLLRTVEGHEMAVSEISRGTYILRIRVGQEYFAQPIVLTY